MHNKGDVSLLRDISFSIKSNEVVAVVGESGSGKSLTAKAIMNLLDPKSLKVNSGEILFKGKNLLDYSVKQFREIQGKQIAMVFQEPMTALNPTMRCGKQVLELLSLQDVKSGKKELKQKVLQLFAQVNLPDPLTIYNKYPHEISGGQKQRVMIAMAISCNPSLLIADEPTTALDVSVQKQIIELLLDLQRKNKMSILFISHDLDLVSSIADRVIVMYRGDIVENGYTSEVFNNPSNTYTEALLNAKPKGDYRLLRLPTVEDFQNNTVVLDRQTKQMRDLYHKDLYDKTPILEIKNVIKDFYTKKNLFSTVVFRALDGVSLQLYPGETLGLVGQSGCGKSTLGNLILKLDDVTSGEILYRGSDICQLSQSDFRPMRKDIQIIFQDPYSSLNPRMTIGKAILEPIALYNSNFSKQRCYDKAMEILVNVGLSEKDFYKYPHEFSGGQRQRVGIARCIALEPKVIVCDESVSALDISVQAQVLNLLNDLKKLYGFSYIFISHDLTVVRYMSDRILVMDKGRIVEVQEADALYNNPQHPFTKELIHCSL
ncbi:dipeptide ABC transporter ATP-binding protein [Myroides sp. LJL115]